MYLIVEGFKDEQHIHQIYPHMRVIVTDGIRMNNRVKKAISEALLQTPYVYLLSDPDEAGDALSAMVARFFPTVARIRLDPSRCRTIRIRNGRVNYGVEHAELSYLQEVLNPYVQRR